MLDALAADLDQLRTTCATSRPSARLATIRQRLARAEDEIGATRLVTTVSAVEALARSLVVHAPGRPPATAGFRYQQVRLKAAPDLVEEALRLHGAPPPIDVFGEPTWQAFKLAHQYRHLVVHECTSLGQDKSPLLIDACLKVLEGLVEAGGLLRVVAAAPAPVQPQGQPG